MKNQRFHRWALYIISCYHAFLSKTYASYANCYFPNGTDRNALNPTNIYQPCDPGDADSMCCGINQGDPDECRSDGLCSNLFEGNIWRESCTDRSWKSSKCLKLCYTGTGQYIEGEPVQLADNDATVTPCGDGSYCCGNGTVGQTCCDKKNGFYLSNGTTTSNNPSGTSVPSSPTTSLPLSRTSVANTQTPNSSKNNTGAIVGGVIGGIIIVLLIVGIILVLARRNKHAGSEPNIPHEVSRADAKANLLVPQELSAANVSRELEARQTHELEHRETRS